MINVGTFAAHLGLPGGAGVCAGKHGLTGFSHAMFEDVRRLGVKVCLIQSALLPPPGSPHDPTRLAAEDVADAVVFALTRSPRVCPSEIVLRGMNPVLGT